MNMIHLLKRLVKRVLPKVITDRLVERLFIRGLKQQGVFVEKYKDFIDISDNKNRVVRISQNHPIYIHDIINSFEYYFSAVVPIENRGKLLVDYSTPRIHEVVGYDLHPIMFPSFAEPIATTKQYMDFAQLQNGSIVLDFGAYSGLTSIMFDQLIGPEGRVISVDADSSNIKCIKKNFELYEKITKRKIELLQGAVWKDNNGIQFSTEGNMGSSAIEFVGSGRGDSVKVKTFTLSTIVKKFNLKTVDFIKCDIEGAESEIFNDAAFFDLFKPRIIIEPHFIRNELTINACNAQLSRFGYSCKEIAQHGVKIPLLECYPPGSIST
jgi:FkbM family methyltransferase